GATRYGSAQASHWTVRASVAGRFGHGAARSLQSNALVAVHGARRIVPATPRRRSWFGNCLRPSPRRHSSLLSPPRWRRLRLSLAPLRKQGPCWRRLSQPLSRTKPRRSRISTTLLVALETGISTYSAPDPTGSLLRTRLSRASRSG